MVVIGLGQLGLLDRISTDGSWWIHHACTERYGPGQWFILSAHYGLVDPDQVLAPYNVSLHQLTACQRESWGNRIVVELTN
jgi:hypothetical protein